LVWRSLSALRSAFAAVSPEVFRQPGLPSSSRRGHPLSGFPSLQSLAKQRTGLALRGVYRCCLQCRANHASLLVPATRSPDGTSLEVSFPYSATSQESPLLVGRYSNAASIDGDGVASTATFPPSGFLTLLTAFSSLGLAGLFHPTSAHGVRTLQSFSLRGSRVASSATCALMTFVVAPLPVRPLAFRALLRLGVR
jgi:hypothetical protein